MNESNINESKEEHNNIDSDEEYGISNQRETTPKETGNDIYRWKTI